MERRLRAEEPRFQESRGESVALLILAAPHYCFDRQTRDKCWQLP